MCGSGTGCGSNQPVGLAKIVSNMTSSSTRGGLGLLFAQRAASHFFLPSFHRNKPSFTNSLLVSFPSCRLSTSMKLQCQSQAGSADR